MRKLLLILSVYFLGVLPDFAQFKNLDEISLQGSWKVIGFFGQFKNLDHSYKGDTPKSLCLSDGKYTKLCFRDTDIVYKGYWLSSSPTGKYFLHLLPWNGGEPIFNLEIKKFYDGYMYVETYDGKGWIELEKSIPAAIENTIADKDKTYKTYSVSGVLVSDPKMVNGVVIKNGKKILNENRYQIGTKK